MPKRIAKIALSLLTVALIPLGLAPAADTSTLPIKLPAAIPPAAAEMQSRIYLAAQKQLHSLLPQVHPWSEDSSLLLITESKSTENCVRPNTGMIYGMAVLYRFGPYDENITGIAREDLLQKILLPMMRYCLHTHKTGGRVTSDGKAWGDAWQSAHWAQMLGGAAWLIWDDLPEEMRLRVCHLVAHEADRFRDANPPHNLHNDTKAEENAWNSQILSLAVVLMPQDNRRAAWDRALQRWALSAFLRPADKTSQQVVDGSTVAEQFTGANVFDDFTLENHGFVHPDYMTAFNATLGSALRYRLAGRQSSQALTHNIQPIYDNLKWFALPDGGFVYPSGQDWELFRNANWIYPHLLMAVFSSDPDAWSLANCSLTTLEKMQARHTSGAATGDGETRFASATTGLLLSLGQSWLVLAVAEQIHDAPQPKTGVLRLDEGKILLHRTPRVVNSISWGAKIMAMCVPLRLDRIISPDQRSGIGHIKVQGSDTPLPLKKIDAQVKNDKDSFSAHLVLMHGRKQIRAEIEINSNAAGEFILSERLTALADITTQEIATGLIGILNNPHWVYETGQRQLTFDNERVALPALSGQTLKRPNASIITVDNSLQITSNRPLAVAYQTAKSADRGRATDKLYLNYLDQVKAYHPGDVISEYKVQIRRIDE